MMVMLQQLLGLVITLALVDAAQIPLDINDNHDEGIGNYSIQPRASCSRKPQLVILNPGDVQTFTSPGYPSPYISRISCGWRFKSRDLITITCSSFALQTSSRGSCRDYLLLGGRKYCGSNGPVNVIVSNNLKIWFKSDRRSNFDGFSCIASIAGTVITTAAPVDPDTVITTAAPVVPERCVCGTVNRITKIVGGVTAEVNEYPWQVALVGRGSSGVYCGGSLINDRWVLTAAHCIKSGVDQVLLGNHLQSQTDFAEIRVNVRRVVDHPNYNNKTQDNDFSLLELATPVDLEIIDPDIRPICLPSASNPTENEGVTAIITGWGTTYLGGHQPDVLLEATVTTMSNEHCNRLFQAYRYGSPIHSSMICASGPGKDSCQGDSGGPLAQNVGGYFNLIGVISWGFDCADPRFPGVYSRVTNAINWITSTSSSGTTCAPP